jgi:hypothetical protein
MKLATMAAIGTALAIAAAAPVALAADEAKAETKATPASGEAKDAKEAKEAPDSKAVKAAGPHLRMAAHHGRNPGRDEDLRHCLDLGTPKEVIRCSEHK